VVGVAVTVGEHQELGAVGLAGELGDDLVPVVGVLVVGVLLAAVGVGRLGVGGQAVDHRLHVGGGVVDVEPVERVVTGIAAPVVAAPLPHPRAEIRVAVIGRGRVIGVGLPAGGLVVAGLAGDRGGHH